MSIWNDCEKYDALPFYGFPVDPSIEGDILTFFFPKGYSPNGDKIQEVAERLLDMVGKEITSFDEESICIRLDEKKLSYVVYRSYFRWDFTSE